MPTSTLGLGWYTDEDVSMNRLDAYQRAGVNMLVPYHHGEPYTSRLLAAAANRHIRVLVQPDSSWIERGDLTALSDFIRRYRHDPAVYAWYLYDEPDFARLPPARLQAAYRAIKAIDSHPVAVAFTAGGCAFRPGKIDPAYLAGFDLLMFDFYPFYTDLPGDYPTADAARIDRTCVQSAHRFHKAGPILILQGFGAGQRDGPFHWRDPTFQEEQCQVALAVAAGATGILFWDDRVADSTVWRHTETILYQTYEQTEARVTFRQPIPAIAHPAQGRGGDSLPPACSPGRSLPKR